MQYHLAIDIGASSGRHILGCVQDGRLLLEEIYRFENGMTDSGGTLCWDLAHLTAEVIAGIARCKALGKLPDTVAIDTWGVDYVLLDGGGNAILPAVAYRDSRTLSAMEAVEQLVPFETLYARTGIQRQSFNTIYQLYCDRESGKLVNAAHLLLMPAYLSYCLTGSIHCEYTEATTTGLVNAEEKTWDREILRALRLPARLFPPLSLPGTQIGRFTPAIEAQVGFNAAVICAPSHDTAAAVAACPIGPESVYISSGTWSLIGTETTAPVTAPAARDANFTNEGGVEYRFRFLKNLMGTWLFQNIRKDLGKRYTYDEMMQMAMGSAYDRTFPPNDPSLLAPKSMTKAINRLLGAPDLPPADTLKSVYLSLAQSYAQSVREIEALTGKEIRRILIVGGGSKDQYLNRLTAQITGKTVVTGMTEGTAIGNLLSQIMFSRGIDLTAARELVKQSFQLQEVTI